VEVPFPNTRPAADIGELNRHDARVTDEADLPSVERLAYLLSGDLQDYGDLPLWEIVWQLNATSPVALLADKLRLVRRAVSQLGDECELWRGTWPGGPVEPVCAWCGVRAAAPRV